MRQLSAQWSWLKPFATRASLMYSTFIQMQRLNYHYFYSFRYFNSFFIKLIVEREGEGEEEERMVNMTNSIYSHLVRSVQEDDRIVLEVALAGSLEIEKGEAKQDDWRLLSGGWERVEGEAMLLAEETQQIDPEGMQSTLDQYRQFIVLQYNSQQPHLFNHLKHNLNQYIHYLARPQPNQ